MEETIKDAQLIMFAKDLNNAVASQLSILKDFDFADVQHFAGYIYESLNDLETEINHLKNDIKTCLEYSSRNFRKEEINKQIELIAVRGHLIMQDACMIKTLALKALSK